VEDTYLKLINKYNTLAALISITIPIKGEYGNMYLRFHPTAVLELYWIFGSDDQSPAAYLRKRTAI